MAEFNVEEINRKKEAYLERVKKIENLLQDEVYQYYGDRYIDSEDESRKTFEGMRAYLIDAKDRLEILLQDLDEDTY